MLSDSTRRSPLRTEGLAGPRGISGGSKGTGRLGAEQTSPQPSEEDGGPGEAGQARVEMADALRCAHS